MNFDLNALQTFLNVNLGDNDAIANLGKDNAIRQKGSYYGPLGALFRKGTTQTANNEVRAALLRSLGNAFNLSGMSEKDGKVYFSKGFMDKLEKLIGPDFKRGDFGVGDDGTVSSGKPLTQRRIDAIVSKALTAGGELDVRGYEKKLAAIQKEVRGMGQKAVEFYEDVGRALNFYKNEIDRVIAKTPGYDPKEAYLFDDDEVESSPFMTFDYEKKRNVPLRSGSQVRDHLASATIANNPLKMYIHLENAFPTLNTEIKGPEDFEKLQNYMKRTVRNFIQLSIDCFQAAKGDKDAMREFTKLLEYHDPCLDGRTDELGEFAMKHLPKLDMVAGNDGPAQLLPADEVAEDGTEIRIPPDRTPSHTENTKLDDCLYQEIYAFKDAVPNAKGWSDIAGVIKKRLVGQTRPIAVLNEMTGAPEPLMKDGVQVVRPVTAEDIDRIGPTCCQITCAFDKIEV